MDVLILPPAPKAGPRKLNSRDQHRKRLKEGPLVEKIHFKKLVMGEVRMLKRGEIYRPDETSDLDSRFDDDKKNFAPESTDDATSQVRVQELKRVNDQFVGLAFAYSPAPSSVPMPLNLLKNKGVNFQVAVNV